MAKLEDKRQQPALVGPCGQGGVPAVGCLTPCQGTADLAVLQEGQRGSCLLVGTGLRSGGCHQLCTMQGDRRF